MDYLCKQWTVHIYHLKWKKKEEGFEEYRCDKNNSLGLILLDFDKVLKLAKPNDVMTILANEINSFFTIKNIIKVSNI